jgi:squalene-hopene/tetraprenyl-beta-curcumene cyclase
MGPRRRAVAAGVVAALLAGCAPRTVPANSSSNPSPTPTKNDAVSRAEEALAMARGYLVSRQTVDGSWRSDTYSSFRDGASLTPLVLLALFDPNAPAGQSAAFAHGVEYLSNLVRPDGTIDVGQFGLSYPVYTAALAVRVLSLPGLGRHRAARDAWLADLRRRQLDETLGWSPEDAAYGGWGYCHAVPKKPKPGEFVPQLLESNLSATVFALDALRAASVPADDPAYRKALVFVSRCQNFADDPAGADPAFDDGGFHFIYDDPARNKAGPAGRDRHGRLRFRSYGSTTADGYRALRLCGLPADHARARAAQAWLDQHVQGPGHAGNYPPERAGDRGALHYYFGWSLAHSLGLLPADAARRLAAQTISGLCTSQLPDGRWTNTAKAVREDDPVLATALAAGALEVCGEYLAGCSSK